MLKLQSDEDESQLIGQSGDVPRVKSGQEADMARPDRLKLLSPRDSLDKLSKKTKN